MAQEFGTMPSVIEEVIRRELGSDVVRRVLVSEEIGSDDAPIYRVLVVYDNQNKRPEVSNMLKTVRAVRGHLRGNDVSEHALISYISNSEAEALEARTH